MQIIRGWVQILFLVCFSSLLIAGKAQFWLAFVLFSIITATVFGRYYCGWACPINTLMRPTTWLAKKVGLADRPISAGLKSEKPRYVVFLFFLVGLAYTIYSITQGRKFPLPLIVIPFGLLATIMLSPVAWHRYLCPWGTLFSLTGRFSRFGFKNSPFSCGDCRKCIKSCPSNSVSRIDKKLYEFSKTNCLMCFKCNDSCPNNSVSYSSQGTPDKNSTKFSI